MGVILSIALTGLFECVRTLEDPFFLNLTMDGINVREELVVLAHQELVVARKMLFPKADDFVLTRDGLEMTTPLLTTIGTDSNTKIEKVGITV